MNNLFKKQTLRTLFLLTMVFCLFTGCSKEEKTTPEQLVSVSVETPEPSVTSKNSATLEPIVTLEPTSTPEQIIQPEKIEIPENSSFSVRFIDVGQGDAALIECDQHYMMIDGGSAKDSDKIYTILRNSNISHLDFVIGSHPDEDHVGGLAGALNYATATMVLCSDTAGTSDGFQNFKKYADKNGGGIIVPSIGDQYQLGSALITILGVNAGIESNDSSIVLKIQYGETSFLFTGDAEAEAEQALLNNEADLSANVLKVAHHGSSSSSSEQFLSAVQPDCAVISVGAENTYLHPTDDVLNRIALNGAQICRTDLQGDIVITSDGNKLSISTEKTASAEELMVSGEAAAEIIAREAQTKAEEEERAKAEADSKNTSTESYNIDYILNKNSKKFHYPDCKSVKQMKEKNKIYFNGTRNEVISQGYDSCGNCHP